MMSEMKKMGRGEEGKTTRDQRPETRGVKKTALENEMVMVTTGNSTPSRACCFPIYHLVWLD